MDAARPPDVCVQSCMDISVGCDEFRLPCGVLRCLSSSDALSWRGSTGCAALFDAGCAAPHAEGKRKISHNNHVQHAKSHACGPCMLIASGRASCLSMAVRAATAESFMHERASARHSLHVLPESPAPNRMG